MRVAYLGPAGTHSGEALRASAPGGAEQVPYPTIYDAVMAVQERAADRAVVPIENALEGGVAVTLDTLVLEAVDVRIGAELVHPDPPLPDRRRSRPTLERIDAGRLPSAGDRSMRALPAPASAEAEHVSAPSTADAVASLGDAGAPTAALGSRLAAELYGGELIAADVEDHPDNATRFVWLVPAAEAASPTARRRRRSSSGAPATRRPAGSWTCSASCRAGRST